MTIDRPVAFPGSPEEIRANRATHAFYAEDGDVRCMDCDCRPSGTIAQWPCGTDVPREVVSSTAAPVSALEALVRAPAAATDDA